jgi:hypothetical protein
MNRTFEFRKQHLLQEISRISRNDWIEKLEKFMNSLEKSSNKNENPWGKYAEPIKEKTDWDEIFDSQEYNLEAFRDFDGNLFEGEDVDELLALLRK